MKDLFENAFSVVAAPLMLLVGLGLMYYVFQLLNVNLEPILAVAIALSPIWLPVSLFYLLHETWMDFVHEKFKYDQGRVTLRIKLPQEVLKSPEAMESVFTQIPVSSPATAPRPVARGQ